MYPEEAAPAAEPLPEYYGGYGGGLKNKLIANFEGLIPLILIIIIGFFLAAKFGVITSATPVVGPLIGTVIGEEEPMEMLIIGSPSQEMMDVLNANRDIVRYRIKRATDLDRNPDDQLQAYDLVVLDQSNQSNQEVSKQLGKALQNFVSRGRKMIVVKDSGIRRPETLDIIGWKATFGDLIPVSCERTINNVPSCLQKLTVVGRIRRQDTKHKIMQGIEVAPAEEELAMIMTTFDVDVVNGKEVAYIEGRGKETFPAIVESRSLIGKVIYFNYDPGKTRGIFEATLEYLR
jgi:hypothetical protein